MVLKHLWIPVLSARDHPAAVIGGPFSWGPLDLADYRVGDRPVRGAIPFPEPSMGSKEKRLEPLRARKTALRLGGRRKRIRFACPDDMESDG